MKHDNSEEKLNADDYMIAPFEDPDEAVKRNTVPHSREAEEAVVGAVFIDGELFFDLSQFLTNADFYIHRLKWIWTAFETLHKAKTPIDLLTVAVELERVGQLDEIGGPSFLTSLVNQVPHSLNAEAYGRIVEADGVRRKIINKANESAVLAYDKGATIEKVTEDVDAIWKDRPAPSKTTVVSAYEAGELLRASINNGTPMAVSTGLAVCDELFGGYPKKAVTMVVGDASTGKTAYLLQGCESLVFSGHTALYVTLEEPVERMVARRAFPQAGATRVSWRNNTLTPADIQNLNNSIDQYQHARPRLFLDDKARTIRQIERSVRQVHPELVVIDDLRHVRLDGKTGDKFSDTGLLIETMTRLKDIAIDEDCAVVVIHHITADEAGKLWPGQSKQAPTQNTPPSLDSITWAKDLRYTVDVWQALVLDYQAIITAEVVQMINWLMKDKEAARMQSVELYYDKKEQWFYDNKGIPQTVRSRINRIPQQPAQKVGAMPSHKPTP